MTNQFPYYSRTSAQFTISTDPDLLNIAVVHRYLSEQSYWAHGVDKGLVERAMRYSFCFGVYAGDVGKMAQIGFARVVTDFTRFAYLADVFIIPEYQGQGLGKWLVACIMAHPDLQTLRGFLLATRDAHELYRRYGGFEALPASDRLMVRRQE